MGNTHIGGKKGSTAGSKAVAHNASPGKNSDATQFTSFNQRPESATQLKLQSLANNFLSSQTLQRKENKTGMSDSLKSGIEHLSGMDMSDVRVHYNSNQPAQLNAHAYAQGTNIHVATGQEKHVPHEAWHVVQQKQGRVKPTKQLKSAVQINDDVSLEKEADVMGAKAMTTHHKTIQPKSNLSHHGSKIAQLAKGRVGQNTFWFTKEDALRAYMQAIHGKALTVAVQGANGLIPSLRVTFIAGQRMSGAQWVSTDFHIGRGIVAHLTMSFNRLALKKQVLAPGSKLEKEIWNGSLELENLHLTLRAAADSRKIEENIGTVLAGKAKNEKKRSAHEKEKIAEYNDIQHRSLHASHTGRLHSGNKAYDAHAAKSLGINPNHLNPGVGNLLSPIFRPLTLAMQTASWDGDVTTVLGGMAKINSMQVTWAEHAIDTDGVGVSFGNGGVTFFS